MREKKLEFENYYVNGRNHLISKLLFDDIQSKYKQFRDENEKLNTEIKRLQEEKDEACDWKKGVFYTTSCGHEISNDVMFPSYDDMKYCPFCGKTIMETR